MAPNLFSRKMERRERILALLAGAIALFIAYYYLQEPWRAYARSHGQVVSARRNFELVQEMQKRVNEAQHQKDALLAQLTGAASVELWAYLTGVVREQGLGSRAEVVSKPTAVRAGDRMSAVQLSMRGISTEELVNVLHRIHSGNYPVALQQLLSLKPSADGKGLDCNMVLIAPKL
ncbi:MAG: hypothetical protein AMXMBFR84_02240 [Candidatus Hydrogenedentota bacterium]